ncbi:MAG: hypothetical protein IJ832_00615 [Bacteroidaceae bacterium]|nr:hypothetical protein [Bacteroidaceae bacterium]
MLPSITLLQAAKAAAQQNPQGSPWIFWIMIMAIFVILSFFAIQSYTKGNKYSSKNSVITTIIKIIALLLLIIGIITIICFIFNGNWLLFAIGIACIINCPLFWGFAYVVEAAISKKNSTPKQ